MKSFEQKTLGTHQKKIEGNLMKKILLLLFTLSFGSCKTEMITDKKEENMFEKFDIETYKKNENQSGQYFKTLPDGTEIMQSQHGDGFLENVYPKNSWFMTQKLYYKNGVLKEKIERCIKGSFQKGIGYFYDENGVLLKEIDYDKPYRKFSWEKLLELLKQKDISMENVDSIGRRETTLGARWYVEYIKDPITEMGEILTIDAENEPGKILNVKPQDFRKHLE